MQLIELNYYMREDVLVVRRSSLTLHQPMPLAYGGHPVFKKAFGDSKNVATRSSLSVLVFKKPRKQKRIFSESPSDMMIN